MNADDFVGGHSILALERFIENQSLVLHEYAASMPEALNAEIMEFIDNGYTEDKKIKKYYGKIIDALKDIMDGHLL